MSMFSDAELSYLRSQRLGRLATADSRGRPHAVPVGYRYLPEADAIAIGGLSFDRSKKWRDLRANPEMAFVVDDLASVDPWSPRGIEIRGRAELHDEGGDVLGPGFGAARLRVQARRIVSWGLGAGPSGASARSVS